MFDSRALAVSEERRTRQVNRNDDDDVFDFFPRLEVIVRRVLVFWSNIYLRRTSVDTWKSLVKPLGSILLVVRVVLVLPKVFSAVNIFVSPVVVRVFIRNGIHLQSPTTSHRIRRGSLLCLWTSVGRVRVTMGNASVRLVTKS